MAFQRDKKRMRERIKAQQTEEILIYLRTIFRRFSFKEFDEDVVD